MSSDLLQIVFGVVQGSELLLQALRLGAIDQPAGAQGLGHGLLSR